MDGGKAKDVLHAAGKPCACVSPKGGYLGALSPDPFLIVDMVIGML